MATTLSYANSFTLPTPNLGTYRWVDVVDSNVCSRAKGYPIYNYLEQLNIIDEEIFWKKLTLGETLKVCKGYFAERRKIKQSIT